MRHVYQGQTIGGADILNSLADVNIGNPEDGQMLVYDASTQRWRNVTQKSLNDLAEVTDLTNVIATGSTNATGATIPKGLYFYLNDDLCQAKVNIADGATFTLNTNYEVVTAGGLNSLNSAIAAKPDIQIQTVTFTAQGYNMYLSNAEIPTGKSYALISADPAYELLGSRGYVRIRKTDGTLFTDQTVSFQVIVLIF